MPLLPPEIIGGPVLPSAPTGATPPTQQGRLATRFVWPLKGHVISTTFCDPKYHAGLYGAALRGYWHTGLDLNVAGTSGNGDAGSPVKAIANGVVEYVAYRTAGGSWGPMVVIRHELPDGKIRWSRYAHLGRVTPKIGDFVKCDQQIAVIGLPSAWGASFPAHLHFDVMHTRPFRLTHWPQRDGPISEVTGIYQDPAVFLKAMNAGEPT